MGARVYWDVDWPQIWRSDLLDEKYVYNPWSNCLENLRIQILHANFFIKIDVLNRYSFLDVYFVWLYCFHPGANSMTTVFVLVLLLVCKLWLARLKNWFLPELSCPRHRQTVKLDTVNNMSVEWKLETHGHGYKCSIFNFKPGSARFLVSMLRLGLFLFCAWTAFIHEKTLYTCIQKHWEVHSARFWKITMRAKSFGHLQLNRPEKVLVLELLCMEIKSSLLSPTTRTSLQSWYCSITCIIAQQTGMETHARQMKVSKLQILGSQEL